MADKLRLCVKTFLVLAFYSTAPARAQPTPAPEMAPAAAEAPDQVDFFSRIFSAPPRTARAKQILSFGAPYDFQDEYSYWAVDGTLDVSLGDGVVTAQVDLASWDGGEWIPGLPKQRALMAEAGYSINALRLAPILRADTRIIPEPAARGYDQLTLQAQLFIF